MIWFQIDKSQLTIDEKLKEIQKMNGASQQKFNQGTKADNKKIEEIASASPRKQTWAT